MLFLIKTNFGTKFENKLLSKCFKIICCFRYYNYFKQSLTVHGVKMIKYITLFFGYCFSLKLTSSTVWFRDLTAKFKTKLKGQKENEQK